MKSRDSRCARHRAQQRVKKSVRTLPKRLRTHDSTPSLDVTVIVTLGAGYVWVCLGMSGHVRLCLPLPARLCPPMSAYVWALLCSNKFANI